MYIILIILNGNRILHSRVVFKIILGSWTEKEGLSIMQWNNSFIFWKYSLFHENNHINSFSKVNRRYWVSVYMEQILERVTNHGKISVSCNKLFQTVVVTVEYVFIGFLKNRLIKWFYGFFGFFFVTKQWKFHTELN